MKILLALLILLIPLGALAQNPTSVTKPSVQAGDPATCGAGDWWFNSVIPSFRGCPVTNTPQNLGNSTPGGSSGQIQINNGGLFGGITAGGDCTFSTPNFTCTKTSGTPFGAMSTLTATASGGDITGTWPTITVAKVSGVAFSSTNVNSAPVIRDGSGNFAAGTITASLTGTATAWSGQLSIANTSFMATSQDLMYRNAGGALDNFGIGTNGQCLGVSSSLLAWIACGSGGNTAWQANGSAVVTSGTFNAIPGFGMSVPLTNVGGVATMTPAVNTAVILSNANAEAGKPIYCSDATGTSAGTCSLSAAAALTVYTTGQPFLYNPSAPGTTSDSLNIDSVGIKSIKKEDGTTDPNGAMLAGHSYWIWYDGTVFRMLNSGQFPGQLVTLASGFLQQTGRSVDPTCSATSDIGKSWIDNTSAVTTHFKVCVEVASTPTWVSVI